MQTYTIDTDQTALSVSVRRILSGKGMFARVAGSVQVDESGTPRAIELSIDTQAFHSGIAVRDAHLRTASFLDAHHYPMAVYTSQDIEPIGQDHYTIRGQLRLRGQVRGVSLHATLKPVVGPDGARSAFVSGVVSRAAFGIASSGSRWRRALLNALLGDDIYVAADVALTPVHVPVATDVSDPLPHAHALRSNS